MPEYIASVDDAAISEQDTYSRFWGAGQDPIY